MSRNIVTTPDYVIAYGKDHACGWFIQVFDRSVEDSDSPKALIVDKDALFDGLTVDDLMNIADEYDDKGLVRRNILGF